MFALVLTITAIAVFASLGLVVISKVSSIVSEETHRDFPLNNSIVSESNPDFSNVNPDVIETAPKF